MAESSRPAGPRPPPGGPAAEAADASGSDIYDTVIDCYNLFNIAIKTPPRTSPELSRDQAELSNKSPEPSTDDPEDLKRGPERLEPDVDTADQASSTERSSEPRVDSDSKTSSMPSMPALRSRFELWINYVGALGQVGYSLDDTLQHRQDLKSMVLELLDMMASSLRRFLQYSSENDGNPPILSIPATSGFSRGVHHPQTNISQPSISENTLAAVGSALDRLHLLAVAIRRPSVAKQLFSLTSSIANDEDKYWKSYATVYIRRLFCNANRSLVEQLGATLTYRRRRLLDRIDRAQKQTRQSLNIPVPPKVQQPRATEQEIRECSPSSNVVRIRADSHSIVYFIPLRPSTVQDPEISHRYPEPPSGPGGLGTAPCPYCQEPLDMAMINRPDRKFWHYHLNQHIQPYECLFPECADAVTLFADRSDWLAHMNKFHSPRWPREIHTLKWYCDIGHPLQDFHDENSWKEHMQNRTSHPSPPSEIQLKALSQRKKVLAPRDNGVCPLCECIPDKLRPVVEGGRANDVSVDLAKHIGSHLLRLAILSLPSLEDNPNSGAQDSDMAETVSSDLRPSAGPGSEDDEPGLSQGALDCLKSLAFAQMENRFHEIDNAFPGTCEWLPQNATYARWAGCDQGLLWIKGEPGSGKSTLLKYALDHCKATHDDLVLSFFFHGGGDELQKTPLGFYRSLLHQVLRQAPNSLLDLVDTFEKRHKEYVETNEGWQWHQEELWRFVELSLKKILHVRSVWLFIDALDECGPDNTIDLCRWFTTLLQTLPPTHSQLHVCVTCRHYPILTGIYDFEIYQEHENEQDISTYVQGKLAMSSELTASRIPASITFHASGNFIWARLITERVLDLDLEGDGLEKIFEAVNFAPPTLYQLYQDLARKMELASSKLIQWICFATRPLSLDELQWAMAIEPDCPLQSLRECRNKKDYVVSNDRMKSQIQTLSCGLAEVSTSGNTQVVQFIHQSVIDFFVEEGLLLLDSSLASINAAIGVAHKRLSTICIRFLAMEEVGQSSNYKQSNFPFLHYATTSWVAHTKQCDARGIPYDELLELFSWPSNLMETWVRIYRVIDRYSDHCPPSGTSLVHILSRYGILGPLTAILRGVHRFRLTNNKDLSIYAFSSFREIIDDEDGHSRTPLSYAAENGHEAIVKLLLITGQVVINTKDRLDQTPLSYAAKNGHKAVVELLLCTGRVNVNMEDRLGQTPLFHAAKNGHEAVVELLLCTGRVNVNMEDRLGQTPLSYAAQNGHEAIVELLLAAGQVDVEAKDGSGQTDSIQAYLRTKEIKR